MVKKFSTEKEMSVLEAKTLIAKIESKLIIIKNNNNDNEFFCSICSEKKLRKYSNKFNTLRHIASIHFDRNFEKLIAISKKDEKKNVNILLMN